MPKFLRDDLKLFNGIVSDLFPKTKQEPIDYGTMEESMRNICTKMNLKDVDGKFRHRRLTRGVSTVAVCDCRIHREVHSTV